MINGYVQKDNRANGGCYVFYNNKIITELPMSKRKEGFYNSCYQV